MAHKWNTPISLQERKEKESERKRERDREGERESVREREKHSSLNRSSIFEMVPAGVWKVWYINLNSNQAGLTRVFSRIRGRGIGVTFRLYIFFMFKNIHLFFSGLRPNYTIHNYLTLIRNIEPYFIFNPLRKYLPPPLTKRILTPVLNTFRVATSVAGLDLHGSRQSLI